MTCDASLKMHPVGCLYLESDDGLEVVWDCENDEDCLSPVSGRLALKDCWSQSLAATFLKRQRNWWSFSGF